MFISLRKSPKTLGYNRLQVNLSTEACSEQQKSHVLSRTFREIAPKTTGRILDVADQLYIVASFADKKMTSSVFGSETTS